MKQDKEFHKIKAKLSWPGNQTFLQQQQPITSSSIQNLQNPQMNTTYRRWSQIPNCLFVKPLHVVVDENLATTVALSLCYNPQ